MGQKVLILGESGTGKSASMRNFHSSEILLINVAAKQLPFKCNGGKFESINTDSYREIKKAIAATNKSVIVIDDSQYLMANEFMRRATEKGFDKFTEIGQNYWDLAQAINELPENKIVYVMSHIVRDDNGNEKIKTVGKLLDEKITVEGMYSIVLKTVVEDGKYYFQTQNNGHDTCKSPIGLFNSFLIDNDLKAVDKAIRDYYDLEQLDFVDEIDRIDRKLAKQAEEPKEEEQPKRSRRIVEEKEEQPKKTLAEKVADFQNKEPEAEEVTEVPTRRRRAVVEPSINDVPTEVLDEVSEPQTEETTPVRRRRINDVAKEQVEEAPTVEEQPVRRRRRVGE